MSLGCNIINEVRKKGPKGIKNDIFLFDGDIDTTKIDYKGKNVFSLPGNGCQEKVLYKFLDGIKEDDSFWDHIKDADKVSKQFAFKDFEKEPSNSDGYKKWFNNNNIKNIKGLLSSYKKNKAKICKDFEDSINNYITKILSKI